MRADNNNVGTSMLIALGDFQEEEPRFMICADETCKSSQLTCTIENCTESRILFRKDSMSSKVVVSSLSVHSSIWLSSTWKGTKSKIFRVMNDSSPNYDATYYEDIIYVYRKK